MTRPEDSVARALRQVAEQIDPHATAITLDQVRSRATRIRRRRRAGVTGVVAAVVALTVPLALTLTPNQPDSIAPAHPGDRSTLNLVGIADGPAPRVAWLDQSVDPAVLHRPEGPLTLPPGTPDADEFALVGDWLVTVTGSELTVRDAAGVVVRTDPDVLDSPALAVDESGRQVAWATTAGMVRVLQADTATPIDLGHVAGLTRGPVALLGSNCAQPVVEGTDEPAGCTVYLDSDRGGEYVLPGGATGIAQYSRTDPEDPAFEELGDVTESGSPNLADWTARWAGRQSGGCATVIATDPVTGDVTGETFQAPDVCGVTYGALSPDTTRVVARAPADSVTFRRNPLTDRLGMADWRGGELTWWRKAESDTDARLLPAVWEDDQHLLAPAFQDDEWSLVRFDATGRATRVSRQEPGSSEQPLFLVQARP